MSAEPITKQELIEVMDIYIRPFYDILGGILAFFVIGSAVYLVFNGARMLWKRVL